MERGEVEERDTIIPESAKTILIPALKVGAFTGSSGFLIGGVGGIVRSSTPALFALASGFQWFALGSTFWATRGAILHFHYSQAPSPNDRVHSSTIAGGITGGSIGGLIRGRANVLPGALMFSLFSFAGQSLFNFFDERHTLKVQSTPSFPDLPSARDSSSAAAPSDTSFWNALWSMKYSPMRALPDAEYETMLRQRLLRVETEIALVDEKIDDVRRERREGQGGEGRVQGREEEMGSTRV